MASESAAKSAEPYVGLELEPSEFTVTQEALSHYYGGLALEPPEASGATPQAAVAPSMIANIPDSAYTARSGFRNAFGNLWMRQEWEMHEPLLVERPYRVTARVIEIYERRDRTVVVTEVALAAPGGDVAAIGRHHQSYLLSQTSGEVALRDPGSKPGARRFEVPEGARLPGMEQAITLEMCGEFFHGQRNYHTDRRASADLGFRDVVVGGRMTISYIGELLERHFGEEWSRSGRLDVKFTNIVWPSDTVRVHGTVSPREGGGEECFAWIEKPDGTVVVVATASAG